MLDLCVRLRLTDLHLRLVSTRKRSSGELSDAVTPDPNYILGVRIQHNWRERGNQSKWKGTVLDRVCVNPSLFMVKYDGFDCVYGIELFKDERVSNLQVLSEKVGKSASALISSYFRFWSYSWVCCSFSCFCLHSKQ